MSTKFKEMKRSREKGNETDFLSSAITKFRKIHSKKDNELEKPKITPKLLEITESLEAKNLDIKPGEDELTIHMTKDYDMFVILNENRIIKKHKVNDLIERIKTKNMLAAHPIKVNHKMEVMDGQHRLTAARALGVTIYYQITSQITPDDIADINSSTLAWKWADYLHFHKSKGRKDYIYLEKFLEHYDFLKIKHAVGLLSGYTTNPGSTLGDKFKSGEFKAEYVTHAEKVIKMILTFDEYVKHTLTSQGMMNAISRLALIEEFDFKRMVSKLEYLSPKIRKSSDIQGYLDMFEDVYNNGAKNKNYLWFARNNDLKMKPPKPDKDPYKELDRILGLPTVP